MYNLMNNNQILVKGKLTYRENPAVSVLLFFLKINIDGMTTKGRILWYLIWQDSNLIFY